MRYEEKTQRSKAALQGMDGIWQRRRQAAIERMKGTAVKLYFAGKAAADAPDAAYPGSELYVPATNAGWKWMQTELLVPYYLTEKLIRELRSAGISFSVHDAETNTWAPL